MTPTRFPPVFDDSPLAYAFALFSLALVTSVSLAIVINYALEHRREHVINAKIGNRAYPPRQLGITLVGLHRVIVSGLLLTIIFGALPDVVVLLAWGEATERTMWILFELDRLFDGLTLLPFMVSTFVSVRAGPAVDHIIGLDPIKVSLRPTWGMVRDKLKIMGAVLCISVGVTFYKAGLL
ncbi:MAG TPA: hypothetical protein VM662_16660 [Sphingomonas sp.]|nr:hypothetical protein [Sphingomonas sp.]